MALLWRPSVGGGHGIPPPAAGGDEALDRVARQALAEFDLPGGEDRQLHRLPRGINNLNYRVRGVAQDWVLKCHRGDRVAERRGTTHQLELALSDAGLPVPRLRETVGGCTYVLTELGLFTLHPWVAGRHISVARRDAAHRERPAFAADLGRLVGDMHRVAAPHVDGDPPDAGDLLRGPARAVGGIRHGGPYRFRKVARLRRRRSHNAFDRWVLEHLPDLGSAAVAISDPALARLVDQGDLVLDHNDLNWENIILGDDLTVRAVLDFDNAAVVPRSLAVGAAAAVLIGPEQRRLGQFLEAYAEAARTAVDQREVLLGMHLKCLRSTLRSIDMYLSGRIQDTGMIAPWCHHLEECRRALPPLRTEH